MAGCKTKKYAVGGRTEGKTEGRVAAESNPPRISKTSKPKTSKPTPSVMLKRPKEPKAPTATPSVMPKAPTATPSVMPKTPTATPSVMPKTPKTPKTPRMGPEAKPVDETEYTRGMRAYAKADAIKKAMRNDPFPKIGNDLVKFKKGGKVRGCGIAQRGRTKGTMR